LEISGDFANGYAKWLQNITTPDTVYLDGAKIDRGIGDLGEMIQQGRSAQGDGQFKLTTVGGGHSASTNPAHQQRCIFAGQ
jgi:hypothetical protein